MNQNELLRYAEMAKAISALASHLAEFMPDPDKAKELHQISNEFCTLRKRALCESDEIGSFERIQADSWDQFLKEYRPEDTSARF